MNPLLRTFSEYRRAVTALHPEYRSARTCFPASLTGPRMLGVARRLLARGTSPVPGVIIERRSVPSNGHDVPIVTYSRPRRTNQSAALVWIHGGGTILGHPDADHDIASLFAHHLDLLVVSVDYRLAPEFPFPAGLDDCFTVLTWLIKQASTLGVAANRIAVGGASAGGGLAAALAQRATDNHLPLALQLLEYPMLDDRTVTRLRHDSRQYLIWTKASNTYAWHCYLGREPGSLEVPEYSVPARREDLVGLPPAWIGVGDCDQFLDEDISYAARLRKAGVACELHVEPGMPHGADAMLAIPQMTAFRQRMITALQAALQQTGK